MAGYGSDGDFAAWLTSQGLVLPDTAPDASVLRAQGSTYVDATYEAQLQCSRRTDPLEQDNAWPRTGHAIRGQVLADDAIPKLWITASYRAAWLEALTPGWASGSVDPNRRTKREKADVVEREFFAPADTGTAGVLGNVDAVIQGMVTPLFCSGRSFYLAVV